ncbi:LamG-like jellyroll fold domain-containing protein [Micromonospora sp. NPDC048830]|uniref:LamG-like jellyroll fold domain-containing protein n=1 Tax=Micromonospora sp. NPDC048830 TaxID=3364257 RepID=UPI00371079CD
MGAPKAPLHHPGSSGFPLSWLSDLLALRFAWAEPATPQQQMGQSPDRGHYVASPPVQDHSRVRPARGELKLMQPRKPEVGVRTTRSAEGFDVAASRRVSEASTSTSDVFQNPDGSYTRRVHQRPVNFKDSKGDWQQIDNTLQQADDRLRVRANPIDVTFAPRAAGTSQPLMRMDLGRGDILGYDLRGAAPSAATLAGATATYSNVFPNVDLTLRSSGGTVKESLIFRSPDVATEYLYPLRLTGLTPQIEDDGGVVFLDAAGKMAARMPVGWMEDSAVDKTGARATSYAVRFEIVTTVDGPALKVSVDGNWLRDPARKFPVVLDPSTGRTPTTSDDTYVQSGGTEPQRNTEHSVAVGTFDGGTGKAKTLLPFYPAFGNAYAGKRLSAADLNVFLTYQGAGDGCVARRFDVHRVTANWSTSTVKYGTFPPYTPSIGNASPSSTAACGNTAADRTVGTWVSVPMDVDEINEWVTGASTYGLALTASETDRDAWKRFTSTDAAVNCNHSTYGLISCAPFIDVTYTDNVAPQVDLRYPSNNVALDTLTPELIAQGHDSDNWPAKGLRFNFIIYNDQGTQLTSSGWVSGGVWKVPAGVLQWKKTYLYAVQANDYSSSGPTTPMYAFSTQVPQPPITSALAQNGDKGYDGNVGNYTTSDIDAQVTTVGPALAVNRDYNSLDTRVDNAFGHGWSSILDMRTREIRDASGSLQTVAVRYPDGQEAAFGRNNDGTWVAPLGRYSAFKPVTGGYSLTDKDATVYEFTRAAASGVHRITKIADASGRAVTFEYDTGGQLKKMTSLASSRSLAFTWSTPPAATAPHIATVVTDPVVPSDTATALTWTYGYDGDKLTSVCEPGAGTQCLTYGYTSVSQHANTVLNSDPYAFWRLNEAPNTTAAASAVVSEDGADSGSYTDVTLGGGPALPDSTSTSASFNGTSSLVTLPAKAVAEGSYQSIGMWFKTSSPNGVLFSYQKDQVTPAATTTAAFVPALYIGSDGKLRGELGSANPAGAMSSPGPVTDGQWHHVVLAGNGGSQQLFLDGTQVGSLTGAINLHGLDAGNAYLGAGFLGGAWPSQPHSTPTATFFTGSIADVAYYNRGLTSTDVAAMYRTGRAGTPQLSLVTSAAGRVQAQVVYHSVTGRVFEVTDEKGGVWKVGAPTASGSSLVYVSAVLGSQPTDYWRLGDVEAPADAVNVVHSHEARYSAVTFDTNQADTSPFADTYGAIFNGTSSYVKPYNPANQAYPGVDFPLVDDATVEMWFKTPVNHAASGVLYAYQRNELNNAPTTSNWTPALYIGADGLLRGEFYNGTWNAPITSTTKVNDGKWHHVVLSASTTRQVLYLDNKIVGALGAMEATNALVSYIGAGTTRGWPSSSADVSYFKGNIAEFAYYDRELPPTEVDAHYRAAKSALQSGPTATLTPVATVTTTDPTNKTSTDVYDIVNGNRLIAATDALGRTTSYGYDVGGFESVEFDPLGMKTVSARDVRGNTIRSTVCRDQTTCDSTYYKYWPDSTTVNLTPDPRNDQLIEVRDARSQSTTDNTYLTKLGYDAAGNRVSVTSPPVAGYASGRATTMTYSTAATPAVGGGTVPPGLPLTTVSAKGATQRTEYNSAGDAVRITDAAGLVTEFTYDGLGRTRTKTVKAEAPVGDLTTTYTYDPAGQVVEQLDPPVLNQVTGAIHTARTSTTYDADGNVTYRKIEDTTGGDAPRDSTSDYNSHGQLVKTVDAVGAVTLFAYDDYGNLTSAVACRVSPPPGSPCPNGDILRTEAETYDAVGQQLTTTIIGADGTSTRVSSKAYYANGNLASDTDAMNWVTEYEYDLNDNVTKVTRTDGVKRFVREENSYDAVGNLIMQLADNGANWTTHSYDAAGRLVSSTEQPYDLERVTKYSYDADDRVVSTQSLVGQLQTPLQTVENTYDPMGRVTSESVSVKSAALPTGWWRMEEAAGYEAYDSSPSARTLYSYNGIVGRSDGAALFNRTNVLQTQQPALNTTQSYSVSAWVKLTDLNQDQTMVGEGGLNNGAFFLKYSKSFNRWEFAAARTDTSSTTWSAARSSAAPVVNTWTHLVAVFDAGTKEMSLFVNGSRTGSTTQPTPWNAATPLSVGGILIGPNETQLVNGAIDNVQIFQEELSADEVGTLYGGGNGRKATTTVTPKRLTTSYTVDKRGLVTAMTDPMGNLTSFEYDAAGQLAKVVSPSVSTETFGGGAPVPAVPVSRTGYNTFGEATETQDPLTNVLTTRYDAVGRPIKTIMPAYTPPGGTPIAAAETSTVYDPLGQVESSTDRRGKTTTFEYDSLGNVAKVTNPAGKVTIAKYDKVGDLLETVDPTGAKTTATYDYLGRMLTSSQVVRQPVPVTNTTTYGYGTGAYGNTPAAGPWLQKVTTPEGVVRSTTYNWVGEPLTETDGANNVTTTEYDGLGRVVKTTLPDLTSRTATYDGAGRVTRIQNYSATNALLTTETLSYDDNSNPTAVKDARGTTTTFTYDALGNLTGETQPVTATTAIGTSFGYDLAGNQTRFTDGRGNAFWTTYNSWGLPESRIEPATAAYPNAAERTFTVAYDAAGRPVRQDSPGGVSVTNTYDDLGQIRQITGTGAEVATPDRVFDYDDAGRLTGLSVPSGTNTISYDDRGLPLTITGPADNTSFSYNRDGQLASRTDVAGKTSYTYDNVGRLRTASNPTTSINVTLAYNKLSQPATITYGTNNNVRTLTYDDLHRLKTDTLKNAAGTVTLGSITYGYDANGNETSKATTGFAGSASNTYTYDLADRLTSWSNGTTSTTYAYDASGNRTQNGSKTFTYDARNQLLTQNDGSSYLYTARGTLKRTMSGSVAYDTQTDAFGQVRSQQAAGGVTTSYDYDGLGRAIKPGFAYTGLGNHLAKDGTATYTRGPAGELFGVGSGAGAGSRYAWTDQHWDVVGQFSATGTALAGSTTYDPLGSVLTTSGMVGNLGYQSEWTDGLSGRVNMLARWYNPATGQFDTRDSADVSPVPDSVAANRFQYGDGNPLTTVDPTGHWGWSSFKRSVSSVARVVTNPVSTFRAATTAATSAFKHVTSGRTWKAVKSGVKKATSKATKAWNVVKKSTVRWVKKKANSVKDAMRSAKKCLSGGVGKCVKETAKKAVKKAVDSAKATVEAIKKDPWKFVATAAAGLVAAVAIGALCATGVGCLILAGAAAGAMAAGTGFMVDVSRGDQEFSWSGLAGTMIEGGLDGALSAGLSRLGGGLRAAAGGAKAAAAAGSRLPRLGGRAPGSGDVKAGGGGSNATADGGGRAASAGGSSGGPGAQGRHRQADGSADCTRHSFDPSTRVLLADGSSKPIEDLQHGDKVAATDPETGRSAAKPVTQLHVNQDRDLTDVTVRDDKTGKTTVVKTTQHHPFWDATDGRWVDAAKLAAGHRLLVHDDKRLEGDGTGAGMGGGGPGDQLTVVEVRNYTGDKRMHDLTVADIHTYYVLAGNTPVLVHNCTVVLGLNHPDEGIGADALAERLRSESGVNAYTFNGPELGKLDNNGQPMWMNKVDEALRDKSVHIAVTLDGLTGATPLEQFQNSMRAGQKLRGWRDVASGNGTNWEMSRLSLALMLGKRSPSSVSWYVNGVKQSLRLPTTDDEWVVFKGLG